MKNIYILVLAACMAPILSYAQPANDNCDGAIELILDGAAATVDNTGSDIDGEPGSCYFAGVQSSGDVWYTFTTTEVMNIAISTVAGTTTDSQIALYTIEGCGSGSEVYTEVTCNDDANGTFMSEIVAIDLPAGTYYIKAGNYNDETGTYEISLSNFGDTPVNSNCEDAVVQDLIIDGATVTVTGSGTNAIDIAGLGQPHVWEAFTIADCATVTIDMCGTATVPTNFYIALFGGCPFVDGTTPVIITEDYNTESCPSDSNMTATFLNLAAGTYYYPVMSSPAFTVLDNYTLNMTAVTCTPEPDTCLTYEAGPWVDFNDIFGGAPVADADGVCPVNQITSFEVFASESYTVDGFVAGVTYTFSICDSPNAGSWAPAISVTDSNGVVVAYVEDCTVTWTAEIGGTYVIGISEVGACFSSTNTATANGYPTLTCEGTTGIEEVDNAIFSVFPNPSNGDFSIRNAGLAGDYTIKMVDLSGRVIHQQISWIEANSVTQVSTDEVAPGMYVINIINNEDNSSIAKRIIIQ